MKRFIMGQWTGGITGLALGLSLWANLGYAESVRARRVPKPIEPLQTLTYEDRKGVPRITAHFTDKIANYTTFGDIEFNIQYGNDPRDILPEGPFREDITAKLMTIWEGRDPKGFSVDPETEDLLYKNRKTVVIFRASAKDAGKFPQGAMDNIWTSWVDHYHWVLEPAKLFDLSRFNDEDVYFAIFWGKKPMPEGADFDVVLPAILGLFQGKDSPVLEGDAWGRLNYRGFPINLGFYIRPGKRNQDILLQYDSFFRSIVKEVTYVRRTLDKLKKWKDAQIASLNTWKSGELAKDEPFNNKLKSWHEARLAALNKIASLYLRNEAAKELDSDFQRRKAGLDTIHGDLEKNYLHRVQFINKEAVRQTKEFELLGRHYEATLKAQMDPELTDWKKADAKMAETRKSIEIPESTGPADEQLIADVERKFPLPLALTLPPSCARFRIQLERSNELKLVLLNPGEQIDLLKGVTGIRSIACQDDAMLIALDQVSAIPPERFHPLPKSEQDPGALSKRSSGGGLILIRGDRVVMLLKGLNIRPFARVEVSQAAGFFDVWLKEPESSELNTRYVVRIRQDGEVIDHTRFYAPSGDEPDLSELKDISNRFVVTPAEEK